MDFDEIVSYSWPLIDGRLATLVLPIKLTPIDAERIAKFLKAIAEEPASQESKGGSTK